jgi:hypothetical protein
LSYWLKSPPGVKLPSPRRKGQKSGPDLQDLIACLRSLKRVRWKLRRPRFKRYTSAPKTEAVAAASDEGITPDRSRERNE